MWAEAHGVVVHAACVWWQVGMPATSARHAVWLAPVEPSRMNARHTSAPAWTISALRWNPAARPCARQAAGVALDPSAPPGPALLREPVGAAGARAGYEYGVTVAPHGRERVADGAGVGPGA